MWSEGTIRSSQVTSSLTKATAPPCPEPSTSCLMTASIPETHPALRGWQKETESPPSFLWVINVSAKCMCLISSSDSAPSGVCKAVQQPGGYFIQLSCNPFFYSLDPADARGALWHLHRCPLQPLDLSEQLLSFEDTALHPLGISSTLFSGKQQQAQTFVQNLLQRCGSPCLWAESIGIYPENTRKWEQAVPLSGTAGFWIKPDLYTRTKQKSRFWNIVFEGGIKHHAHQTNICRLSWAQVTYVWIIPMGKSVLFAFLYLTCEKRNKLLNLVCAGQNWCSFHHVLS